MHRILILAIIVCSLLGCAKRQQKDCMCLKTLHIPRTDASIVVPDKLQGYSERDRNGRTNDEIIDDLHSKYPAPMRDEKTFGFTCSENYHYAMLHFPGEIRGDIETGGLYIGTCLP